MQTKGWRPWVAACLGGLSAMLAAGAWSAPADQDELLAVDREFARMSAERGMHAAFLAYAAPDAMLVVRGVGAVRGIDAIARQLRSAPEPILNWEPLGADIAASGDLGYTWGEGVFRSKEGGDPLRTLYVSVWKRQADGKWKWVIDIGNPKSPLPSPPPPPQPPMPPQPAPAKPAP